MAIQLENPTPPRKTSIQMQSPPELEPSDGISTLLTSLLPMLGSVGAIVMTTMSNAGPTGYITSGMFLLTSLGFVGVNGWRQRSQRDQKVKEARKAYYEYLDELRDNVRTAANQQLRYELWKHPEPSSYAEIVKDGMRLWQPMAYNLDDSFEVRVGTTNVPLSIEIEPPEIASLTKLDPIPASAAHKFLLTHSEVEGIPKNVSLNKTTTLEIVGNNAESCRSLARLILSELIVKMSPDDLKVCIFAQFSALTSWEFAKELPHIEGRFISDIADLETAIKKSDSAEEILVISDGEDTSRVVNALTQLGAKAKVLSLPKTWGEISISDITRLNIEDDKVHILRLGKKDKIAQVDGLSIPEVITIIQYMKWTGATVEEAELTGVRAKNDILALHNIQDVNNLDFESLWRLKLGEQRLNVPIGLTPENEIINLDIKEAAQGGMGPNGAMVGTVGSGKSEVIKTIILSLMLQHTSEQLNFVLIDFKGGSTYFGLEDAPHVSAIITNLEGEASLVDRLQEALEGEISRRQEVLAAAQTTVTASVSDVEKYERERRDGNHTDWEPLPALFIIADEFSALLDAKPEFAETFQYMGKVGRSLDIHILIASQRFEESRLKGLESNLAYRVGLRTETPADSRAIIGTDDSALLPREAGWGYLKPDQTHLNKFRATYVSGTVKGDKQKRSLFDVLVQQMTGKGLPAHKIWLDPLVKPIPLDALFDDLNHDTMLSEKWRNSGALTVPIGLVDLPAQQTRDYYKLDLTGQSGHIAIAGGPQSGKSTACRTIISSLALTHTPQELQFYALDFGGGGFTALNDFPHMAAVVNHTETDKIHRTIAEITSIINEREQMFIEQGIDGIDTYRKQRLAGKVDDGYGELFLLIDGWALFKEEYEALEPAVQQIVARGLNYGVHVVITCGRWMEIRPNIKDVLNTRIELRLGEPGDSEIDRKQAHNVPIGVPGRGIVAWGGNRENPSRHFMLSVPRIDGAEDVERLSEATAEFVTEIAKVYEGVQSPKLRLLPEMLPYAELTRDISTSLSKGTKENPRDIALGIDENELLPFIVDSIKEPAMYLFGDSGSGKSSFLRLIMHEVARKNSSKEAKFIVIDPRRSLLGEIPDGYNMGYYNNPEDTVEVIAQWAAALEKRKPGTDVTRKQLRERSWWEGADLYILVDDYDLVAPSGSVSPLAPLVNLLPYAADIGLHLFITRRTGGASGALYDPIIKKMNDLGSPALLLSGSPDEGALVGKHKPEPLVPGRAKLITREGAIKLQLAYAPTDDE